MKLFVAHKMTQNNALNKQGSCSRDSTTAVAVAECKYVRRGNSTKSRQTLCSSDVNWKNKL